MNQRQKTERELRLHMANLCLAVLSKEEGRLRECSDMLVDKVCELIAAAEQRERELLNKDGFRTDSRLAQRYQSTDPSLVR